MSIFDLHDTGFLEDTELTRSASGFSNGTPLQLVFLPDGSGRMLIVEKKGRIIITNPDDKGGLRNTAMYLKLNETYSEDEVGLLSVVTETAEVWVNDPAIYVYWAAKNIAGQADGMRISRFQHLERNGGLLSRADKNTEQTLWIDTDGFPTVTDQQYRNGGTVLWHYGGQLSIGPDGHLYIGVGDKYMSHLVENRSSVAGCVLRIARDGSIPSGNLPTDVKPPQCWSYGLRNPYRSMWAADGKYYIAEVGGNNHDISTEDIHIGGAGKHYGWPHCEGYTTSAQTKQNFPTCDSNIHDNPLYSYPHRKSTACIIGGFMPHGPGKDALPEEYQNAYFFTDFIDGHIWYIRSDRKGTNVKTFGKASGKIAAMTFSPTGDIWFIESPDRHWVVKRIRYQGNNFNPNALVSIDVHSDKATGIPPFDVTFTATPVTETGQPPNAGVNYIWDFGDGTPTKLSDSPTITHRYEVEGEFHAKVDAEERYEGGRRTSVTSPFGVVISGIPPNISITSEILPGGFVANQELTLSAIATDSDGTDLTNAILWEVYFHHEDHLHPYDSAEHGGLMSMVIPNSGHSFEGDTGFIFVATVTNAHGLKATAEQLHRPTKTQVVVSTEPAGGQVHVDGGLIVTPKTLDSMVGFTHLLRAKDTILVNNQVLVFQRWSDGSTNSIKYLTSVSSGSEVTALYVPGTVTSQSLLTCDALGFTYSKWQSEHNSCCNSHELSGGCFPEDVTYVEAEETCLNAGQRLCTIDELLDDSCRGSGCKLDRKMIWTRIPCDEGMHYTALASTKSGVTNPQCVSDTETQAGMRCCADSTLSDVTELNSQSPTMSTQTAPPTTPKVSQPQTSTKATTAPITTKPTITPSTSPKTSIPTLVPTTTEPTPAPIASESTPASSTSKPTTLQEVELSTPRTISAITCEDYGLNSVDNQNQVCIIRKFRDSNGQKTCIPSGTFKEAMQMCEAQGAKLCSVAETGTDDGLGKGCKTNKKHVWTRGTCDGGVIATGATSKAIGGDECVTDPHAIRHVQCCLDTVLQPQKPEDKDANEGPVVSEKILHTISPASSTPTVAPTVLHTTNLPTTFSISVSSSHTRHLTFAPSTPPTELQTDSDSSTYSSNPVTKTSHSPQVPALISRLSCHELGWRASKRVQIHGVCGATPTSVDGICPGEVDFEVAIRVCEDLGARLCRPEELAADVVRGSGCWLDRQPIWTSQTCDSGYIRATGSSKVAPNPTCGSTAARSVASMRCCADE